MKKVIFISLLLLWLTLAWCTQKMDQEDLFEKKQECVSYRNELQKQIDKDSDQGKDLWIINTQIIKEIFYSKKENSCFASINSFFWPTDKIIESRKIVDLLTNETTTYYYNEYVKHTLKIKELKWE